MPREKIELTPASTANSSPTLPPGSSLVGVYNILLRKHGDTRTLNAAHVVLLAESIGILGLLEPVIIDSKGHLLAGGHRLAALQLLGITDPVKRKQEFLERVGYAAPSEATGIPKELEALTDRIVNAIGADGLAGLYPRNEIPVIVVEVGGKDAKSLPLAIEAAENNVRRQYTVDEIKSLAERFKDAGYTVSEGGRPKKGEKTVLGALEAALGRSRRQIQRYLSPGKAKRGKSEWDKALAAFRRAAQRVVEVGGKKEGDAEKTVVGIADRATKALEKLGGE
jgi:ParB-like chromosome segregation protein Spo0J